VVYGGGGELPPSHGKGVDNYLHYLFLLLF
jgi:hypothetical protein